MAVDYTGAKSQEYLKSYTNRPEHAGNLKDAWSNIGTPVHALLGGLGMASGIGEPVGVVADLLDTALYALEGDKAGAGLSAASAIPGIGLAAGATKLGKLGSKSNLPGVVLDPATKKLLKKTPSAKLVEKGASLSPEFSKVKNLITPNFQKKIVKAKKEILDDLISDEGYERFVNMNILAKIGEARITKLKQIYNSKLTGSQAPRNFHWMSDPKKIQAILKGGGVKSIDEFDDIIIKEIQPWIDDFTKAAHTPNSYIRKDYTKRMIKQIDNVNILRTDAKGMKQLDQAGSAGVYLEDNTKLQ